MVIDNVSSDVNGTIVECSYGDRVVSTDIIKVIRNGMFDMICMLYNFRHFLYNGTQHNIMLSAIIQEMPTDITPPMLVIEVTVESVVV